MISLLLFLTHTAISRPLPRNNSNGSAVMNNPLYRTIQKGGDTKLYPWEPVPDNPSPIYDDPDNLGWYK